MKQTPYFPSRMLSLMMQLIVFVLLLQKPGGQPHLIGSSQPIVAIVGDDIVLPCRLEPAINASNMRLEWARPDLSPGFVHVRANGQEYVVHKHPTYRGRTSVSIDRLQLGDVSLKLSNARVSDEGTYRCLAPTLGRAAFIKLVIGAASSPVISSLNRTSSSVVLQCESAGWYPEPDVFWLDGEGNLLSAGPTETVRGPDDLYTVSSRVTVEKRHSNNFTCRVQQKDINQTRETHIYISVLSRYVKGVLVPGFIGVLLGAVFTALGWRPRYKPLMYERDRLSVKQVREIQIDPNKGKTQTSDMSQQKTEETALT